MSIFGITFLVGFLAFVALNRWRVRHRRSRNTIAVSQRLSAQDQARIGLLAASGEKIRAIQELRKLTTTDLATAKLTVEQLAEVHAGPSAKST